MGDVAVAEFLEGAGREGGAGSGGAVEDHAPARVEPVEVIGRREG
ncbi:MAG: hypothetical protein QOG96_4097, partial [Pseudonocardiales bacterium]|nr:hypothetical protein [Pseudonocardiales bacterium]